MCTAITYKGQDFYFGRNLDYEHSFSEKIVVTARDFCISLRHTEDIFSHYAIIGMGIVSNNFPLYFDATNEKGLSVAGLLFPHFSFYHPPRADKINIASFEFIPYILSLCKSVSEAKEILSDINITNTHFSDEFPPTPLHWLIADKEDCIVAESVKDGLVVYDNPVGVLTNAPPFSSQMDNLGNYINISPCPPKSDTPHYSRGLGGVGLPGDLSSQSRFVRASFVRRNSPKLEEEKQSVSQFFHILNSVHQTRGSVITENGDIEFTQYSSCVNADKGIYYYKTHDNPSPVAVRLHDSDLDRDMLYTFDLLRDWNVFYQR